MAVEHQVQLRFGAEGASVPSDLSAVCRDGRWLWLAGDESAQLERLTVDPLEESYSNHRSFWLGDLIDLPDGPDGPDAEVDVEGIDRLGGYLWIVGSHSRSRKRVDADDDDGKAVRSLAKVREHPSRHVLLRVPITELAAEAVPVSSTTAADGAVLTAARLGDGPGGLVEALSSDEHLARFLPIPGKDNGLDIEGIVALGGKVLVGLRGPVLRGWSVVLEVEPRHDPGSPGRLALGLGGPAYRKLFLDLDGLGVRDLCRDGDDILVLAGPTMDLDGPVRLYRWHGAARARDADVVRGQAISRVVDLPYGEGVDHAEGVTLLPAVTGRLGVLVVYDSPAPARLVVGGGVLADIVTLPARP